MKRYKHIVDCFPYFNEKELLELRINLLKDYVDEFLIIDANYTHSGNKKEFTCKKTIESLGLINKKIKIIEADLSDEAIGFASEYDRYFSPGVETPSRERIQRDYITNFLQEYQDDTVFILSDCDEIINPKNIEFLANIAVNLETNICKIPLVYLQSRADCRVYSIHTKQPYFWDCSMFMATKQQLLKHPPTHIRANYYINYDIVYACENLKRLEDLGWHFSWMGDIDRVKTKAVSYCHYGDIIDNYLFKELYGEKLFNYIDNYKLEEGNYTISGLDDAYIQKYPLEELPQKLFDLPRVRDFLLPLQ